jgi:MoxR-like ATPase
MSNVWRIGSNWGGYGPIKTIFERHRLAFAGDEVQDLLKKVIADDIVAITSGKRIIGVGRVARVAALSEIGIDDFTRFGDRIALVLSPLFWRDENEQWLDYDGQGKQFHKAHGDYVGAIIAIFDARNRQLQKDKMKNEIKALLEANNQTILTGAPGTGKTFLAREVAADMLNCSTDELKSKEGFSFVQFHPAYDYTDFVEGLKPVKAGNNPNNSIGFELCDGVFMEFCKKAEKQDGNCVFVIDEINRADLSRVFGELFYALEPDYRGEPVLTQYASLKEGEEKQFRVPKNVFIIGTMNDIDRSVESIDFALRRRFAWYEVKADAPRFDTVIQPDLDVTIKEKAKERYLSLNKEIGETEELGESYQIGPAYYRKLKEYVGVNDLWEIFWARHLELLIREYVRGWPKSKKDEQIKKFRAAYNLAQEPATQR